MEIKHESDLFEPDEMTKFGFDPNSETDREEWVKTTPPGGTPVVYDYSSDPFEFGSVLTTSSDM